jgi:hypothetical protein
MTHATDAIDQRITEACDALWDALVDPREAYLDDEGLWWRSLAVGATPHSAASPDQAWSGLMGGLLDEQSLAAARADCRRLAAINEFAINGHENRISYLVGPGHQYRAVTRKGAEPAPTLVAEVQAVLDEFLIVNAWHARQQEIVRRMDRDGEAFLRFFSGGDGVTRVRFVEPEQVATPPELARAPGPASAFRPSRTTSKRPWATTSTASRWTPPTFSTARRTSMRT